MFAERIIKEDSEEINSTEGWNLILQVRVEFILAIFKNFCKSELFICYHIDIFPLGGLVDSFSQLYFTINLEEIFCF